MLLNRLFYDILLKQLLNFEICITAHVEQGFFDPKSMAYLIKLLNGKKYNYF